MDVCIDTSAVLALRSPHDENHAAALRVWRGLDPGTTRLYMSAYGRLEAISLLHRRLGLNAVRDFRTALAPLIRTLPVDESAHERALDAVLAGSRRGPSLTDTATFEVMHQAGIQLAFAFDPHFEAAGFTMLV